MKRELEEDIGVTSSSSSLPTDVWRVIVIFSGLQLLLQPVCRQWLQLITEAIATEQAADSIFQQWIHDVADSRTCPQDYEQGTRPWCRSLRSIPNIVDLSLCRDFQRVADGALWLIRAQQGEMGRGNRGRDGDPAPERIYLLWRECKYVLRVIPRRHYAHLVASGEVALRTIPLSQVGSALRGSHETRALEGDERHCIKTVAQYKEAHAGGKAFFVNASATTITATDVVRHLRKMRDWEHLYQRVSLDYRRTVEAVSPQVLQSVWLAHCEKFADSTERTYNDMVARGEQHWVMADNQMASDVCHLIRRGLLVVDARGTRAHAPHSYNEAEWTQVELEGDQTEDQVDEEDDVVIVPPLRAYVRLYAPRNQLMTLSHTLPSGALWFHADTCDASSSVNMPFADKDDGRMRYRQIRWPYMCARGNRCGWERETYGLERLTDLLHLELVEIVDVNVDRPDGYLFTELAKLFPVTKS